MNITIDYTALYAVVERSLSVIGKRSTDDQGNQLFTDVTLGTREQPIVTDYIREAVIDLAAELSAFITAESGTAITITLPSNHNTALEGFVSKSCEAYCVSYALYSWFSVTAPRLVEKQLGNMNRQLAALVRLIHEKKAPVGSQDILETSTNVTQ